MSVGPIVGDPMTAVKDREPRATLRKDGRWQTTVLLPSGHRRYFYAATEEEALAKRAAANVKKKRKKTRRLMGRSHEGLTRRFAVLHRDGFRCVYCGRPATEVELQVDHIIPVAAGGSSDLHNLATACVDCNLGKKARVYDLDSITVQVLESEHRLYTTQMPIEQVRHRFYSYSKDRFFVTMRDVEVILGPDLWREAGPELRRHAIRDTGNIARPNVKRWLQERIRNQGDA